MQYLNASIISFGNARFGLPAATENPLQMPAINVKVFLIFALIAASLSVQAQISPLSEKWVGNGDAGKLKSAGKTGVTNFVQTGDLFEYITAQPALVNGVKTLAGGLRKETMPVVFTEPEVAAQFIGGSTAWKEFVASQKPYLPLNDEGGVLVTFIVDNEGNILQIAVLNQVSEVVANAATRLLNYSGNWQPATHQQAAVHSRVYTRIQWQ